jgi:hypothetical protein
MHLQERCRQVAGDCHRCVGDSQTPVRRGSETTGGLRPPLLRCCANVRRRKTIFALHKRRFNQERRASARRGSVIRTSCGQNRAMFGDWRTLNQERRSSARRGWTGRTLSVMCWKRTCKRGSETTGGLRPPLLRCCANVRRRKTIFAMHKRRFNQERRASARRGSVIRTSCGQNRAMFGD